MTRTRDDILAEYMAAGQSLPPFESATQRLVDNLGVARANLKLAQESGDTAMIEDWRLTVKVNKCAVELNLANIAVLRRMIVRCEEELRDL